MTKPKRTCFGRGMCLHIGPCCDFWADDGMCVCNPVDASEYPQSQRLYVAGNTSGFSSPNIRTIFPDGSDHVHTLNRGDYGWAWWDWGSGYKKVTFQLRDGGTVRASRSTRIMGPDDCSVEGERRKPSVCPSGAKIFLEACREGRWVPSGETCPDKVIYKGVTIVYRCDYVFPEGVWGWWDDEISFTGFIHGLEGAKNYIDTRRMCVEGEKRGDETCWDTSVIQKEVCRDNRWVTTGEKCPIMPAHGAKRNPTTCWDGSVIYTEKFDANRKWWVTTGEKCPVKLCEEGEKRDPYYCWDDSVIHKEICRGNKWNPTGEKCVPEPVYEEPPKIICTEGEKRDPETCWDGQVIHKEICRGNKWNPTGEKCVPEPVYEEPPKPECRPGDKKAGYVCKDGKWIEYTPPAPVVEPTVPEPEIEEGCYIHFDIPVLEKLPGIPCQWWTLPMLPGFKKTKKT